MNFHACVKGLFIKPPLTDKLLLIMKLAVLLTLAAIFQATASTYAQRITIKAKRIPLAKAMDKVHEQTGYQVLMSGREQAKTRVDIDIENVSLSEAMEALLKDLPMHWTLKERTIVVTPSARAQPNRPPPPPIQQREIRGNVVDEFANPLEAVTVTVKGTPIATTTDADGNFSIRVPQGASHLVFSTLGFEVLEQPIGTSSTQNAVLKSSVSDLEEVVVVAYGVQKKESVVGAISSVSGEDIAKSPTVNLTQALAGRLPGLTAVQGSGQPGFNAASILIRGQPTFGNAAPIIIVDGIERQDFGNIDPNEVESINILKDASATAVYGIRGANGVIVVTTKRGQAGKPVISYTGNFSLQNLTGIPKILNAYNSAFLKNEALFNDALPVWFTQEELQKFKDGSDPVWYPNVNWYEEVTRDVFPQTQHNINVRGGTDVASYFISAGYTYEDGMTKDYGSDFKGFRTVNNFQRFNFRSNVDLNLSDNLKVGITLGGVFGKAYSPGDFTFGDINFVIEKILVIPSYAIPVEIPGVGYAAAPSVGENLLSPIGMLRGTSFQTNENNNLESILNVQYKLDRLTEGLTFRGTFAFDSYSNNINRGKANPTVLYDILDRRNQIYQVSPIWRLENYSFLIENNPNNGRINMNLQGGFDYARSWGKHSVTGLLLGYRQFFQSTGIDAINAMQGVSGRVTYDYDRRYLLEVNTGYNGSENFAKGKRYDLFPAIALGYNLANEHFLANVNWLDQLKIRGSYGITGSDAIGRRFLFLNDYQTTGQVQFGDPNSVVNFPVTVHSLIGNPDVTWEKSTKRNIGVESGFFGGLVRLTVDLFDERRRDILVNNPQSRLTQYGEDYPAINVGEVYNKGYEVDLGLRKMVGQVHVALNSQLSFARNRIINIDEPIGLPDYQKQQGKRIGQYFGYLTDGFYQSEEDILNSPTNTLGVPIPGDLKFKDYNNDGQITPDDRVPIGYANRPEFNYSIAPAISWKGITAEILLQGTGNVSSNIILTETSTGQQRNAGQQMYEWMLNRWTPETAATATWPALHSSGNAFISYNINDYLLQNAAYLKIRNAQLSWSLPKSWCNGIRMEGIRVFASGQNLYTWTNYRFGYDPEISGVRNYPTSRIYNFGVTAQF